jgi:hypothetical protein
MKRAVQKLHIKGSNEYFYAQRLLGQYIRQFFFLSFLFIWHNIHQFFFLSLFQFWLALLPGERHLGAREQV